MQVMLAASFWSLLAPAIEIAEGSYGNFAFVPVAVGFLLGALFVYAMDKLIPAYVSNPSIMECHNAELCVRLI